MGIRRFALLLICGVLQTGCVTGVWTGANIIYDRHNIYKKLSDYQLAANVNRALYKDKMFKRDDCDIDIGIINGDILIAGYVPTAELREEAYERISALKRLSPYI